MRTTLVIQFRAIPQKLRNQLFEFRKIDGLCNVTIAAGLESFRVEISGVVGGNSNDWSLLAGWKLANEPGRGKAVNQRQTQIHQNQLGLLCLRRPDRFFTIPRFNNPVTAHFQQSSHHEAVVFGVLNQQHRIHIILSFHFYCFAGSSWFLDL